MPTTLQYPVERNRDVQRKWQHLLHRTVAPKSHVSIVKYSPTRGVASTRRGIEQAVKVSPIFLLR